MIFDKCFCGRPLVEEKYDEFTFFITCKETNYDHEHEHCEWMYDANYKLAAYSYKYLNLAVWYRPFPNKKMFIVDTEQNSIVNRYDKFVFHDELKQILKTMVAFK